MSETQDEKQREMAEIRQYEGEARQSQVVVEKLSKDDAQAGHFLNLAPKNANVLSDPTVNRFSTKQGSEIIDLVTTCKNGVRDVQDQEDQAPTFVFSWCDQLENFGAGKRLLGATNTDSTNGGDGAVTSGVCWNQCSSVVFCSLQTSFYS